MKIAFIVPLLDAAQFLKPAIKTILALEGDPITIVFSDQGSSDETLEIVDEAVARYDGPHAVLVLDGAPRAPHRSNAGINIHLNWLMRCSALPDFTHFIMGTGDDLESPGRVTSCLEGFERGADYVTVPQVRMESTTTARHSLMGKDLEAGPVPIERHLKALPGNLHGTASSWSRKIWDIYGPIPTHFAIIDWLMPVWACLEGGHYHSTSSIRSFRVHGDQTGSGHRAANDPNIRQRHHREMMARDLIGNAYHVAGAIGLKLRREPDNVEARRAWDIATGVYIPDLLRLWHEREVATPIPLEF